MPQSAICSRKPSGTVPRSSPITTQAMRHAFLRGHRQQRLERHLHIDAVIGGKAVRHQIKPLQAQHVIEPDRAGVAHRGPQHLAKRLEGLHGESGRIESGKAPVLAERVQRVRRRADGEMAGDRRLLVPGVESVGLHADGDVEIETDLHAEVMRELLARSQLLVGDPLHEFDELDLALVGACAQFGAFVVIRPPPFLRPFPPRLVEAMPQHFKAGKPRQERRAFGAEFREIRASRGFRLGGKPA